MIDSQGQQYIDLVLEGGGTLGIALLGYIHVLEEAGLRFIGIGGTSAGEPCRPALAAAAKPSESRMKPLMEILANIHEQLCGRQRAWRHRCHRGPERLMKAATCW